MATKRIPPRTAAPSTSAAPLVTAAWLAVALCYGVGTLMARGRLHWPPTELLASLYTIAGCLALVGPFVLLRKEPAEVGLGGLIWLAGGLLVWAFDGAAVARGEAKSLAWATPLAYQPMGLTVLAVALAAWRCRVGGGGGGWAWTNVVGWGLGVFWVAMAATTLVPARAMSFALR